MDGLDRLATELAALVRETREVGDRLVRLETKFEDQAKLSDLVQTHSLEIASLRARNDEQTRLNEAIKGHAIEIAKLGEKLTVVKTQFSAALVVIGVLVPVLFKVLHIVWP